MSVTYTYALCFSPGCAQKIMGEPAGKPGVRERTDPHLYLKMDVFVKQGQCGINGYQIRTKDNP